jgi:transcription elongation GreA/GreB family factor
LGRRIGEAINIKTARGSTKKIEIKEISWRKIKKFSK